MAIVKANAYGHGLAEVVHALAGMVAMFGVANVREAEAVRAAAGTGPGIFILGPALPFERSEIVAGGFVPAVSSLREAAAYSALGQGRRVPVHLAIDTGMGRMGIAEEEAGEMVREIMRLPDLEIGGIATHLPVADEDENYTREQLGRFEAVVAAIRSVGVDAPVIPWAQQRRDLPVSTPGRDAGAGGIDALRLLAAAGVTRRSFGRR